MLSIQESMIPYVTITVCNWNPQPKSVSGRLSPNPWALVVDGLYVNIQHHKMSVVVSMVITRQPKEPWWPTWPPPPSSKCLSLKCKCCKNSPYLVQQIKIKIVNIWTQNFSVNKTLILCWRTIDLNKKFKLIIEDTKTNLHSNISYQGNQNGCAV